MHILLLPSKLWFFISITITLILTLPPTFLLANDGSISSCSALISCGDLHNIGYPFWGLNRPESCGHPAFSLNCIGDNIPAIKIESATYRVLTINSLSRILELARADYSDTICPTHLINSTFSSTLFELNMNTQEIKLYYGCQILTNIGNFNTTIPGISRQFNCTINKTEKLIGYYVTRNLTESSFGAFAPDLSRFFGSCNDNVNIPVLSSEIPILEESPSSDNLHEALTTGFEFQWFANDSKCDSCLASRGQCGHNITTGEFICYCSDGTFSDTCSTTPPPSASNLWTNIAWKLAIGVGAPVTVIFVVISFLILTRKKKMSGNQKVKAFIEKYESLVPKRYSYSEIKKMTKTFKDKLGQGGYGSVYKGKLHNDQLVAVKILSESKGDGEDFINEVASICQTSHVNIVTLLGFCYENSKRALIYEFMPNGSLDGFIYDKKHQNRSTNLNWMSLYHITVGIARGLEYLHQGCKTRILHLDIKPHNILLDEEFCPKISDFGLAKLCPRKESIISMFGARGTAGYMAPEVFNRTFGGVSYKSDVYSFGMMVLEMVGGRRNIDTKISNPSQIYFPSWVYRQMELGQDLKLHGVVSEDDENIVRKMILVSMWCIQMNPLDRPTMTKVVEMLEGSLESLQTPPQPFLSSPVREQQNSSPSST